jgi:hypothetical protein
MKLGVESRFYYNPEADVRVTYMQWFGGRGKHLQYNSSILQALHSLRLQYMCSVAPLLCVTQPN